MIANVKCQNFVLNKKACFPICGALCEEPGFPKSAYDI